MCRDPWMVHPTESCRNGSFLFYARGPKSPGSLGLLSRRVDPLSSSRTFSLAHIHTHHTPPHLPTPTNTPPHTYTPHLHTPPPHNTHTPHPPQTPTYTPQHPHTKKPPTPRRRGPVQDGPLFAPPRSGPVRRRRLGFSGTDSVPWDRGLRSGVGGRGSGPRDWGDDNQDPLHPRGAPWVFGVGSRAFPRCLISVYPRHRLPGGRAYRDLRVSCQGLRSEHTLGIVDTPVNQVVVPWETPRDGPLAPQSPGAPPEYPTGPPAPSRVPTSPDRTRTSPHWVGLGRDFSGRIRGHRHCTTGGLRDLPSRGDPQVGSPVHPRLLGRGSPDLTGWNSNCYPCRRASRAACYDMSRTSALLSFRAFHGRSGCRARTTFVTFSRGAYGAYGGLSPDNSRWSTSTPLSPRSARHRVRRGTWVRGPRGGAGAWTHLSVPAPRDSPSARSLCDSPGPSSGVCDGPVSSGPGAPTGVDGDIRLHAAKEFLHCRRPESTGDEPVVSRSGSRSVRRDSPGLGGLGVGTGFGPWGSSRRPRPGRRRRLSAPRSTSVRVKPPREWWPTFSATDTRPPEHPARPASTCILDTTPRGPIPTPSPSAPPDRSYSRRAVPARHPTPTRAAPIPNDSTSTWCPPTFRR